MSKASEWAALSHRLSNTEIGSFRCPAIKSLADRNGTHTDKFRIYVSVGWRSDGGASAEPSLSWTDWRLGGVVLGAQDALALARWIIDTFGEAPTS